MGSSRQGIDLAFRFQKINQGRWKSRLAGTYIEISQKTQLLKGRICGDREASHCFNLIQVETQKRLRIALK